jgi:hypothetical protein
MDEEYCDDDRHYIRPVKKTELVNPQPVTGMAYLQKFLAEHATGGPHGNHHVYWIPQDAFNTLPVKKWRHNRDPDPLRVQEIREFMQTSKRMDGIIYLACVDNELVCYESNHRREALKGVSGLSHILVDILWGATHDIVKEEFRRINKAVSVPELYVEETPLATHEEMKPVVDAFCATYKSLCSSAKHPHRPGFSREMIYEEFYRMLKETGISLPELVQRLNELNLKLRSRDKSKLSDKVIAKCEATGLWLFAWSAKLNAADLR